MRCRFLFTFALYLFCIANAHATGGFLCVRAEGTVRCFWTFNRSNFDEAQGVIYSNCAKYSHTPCTQHILETYITDSCGAVYANTLDQTSYVVGNSFLETERAAYDYCLKLGPSSQCRSVASACDGIALARETIPIVHFSLLNETVISPPTASAPTQVQASSDYRQPAAPQPLTFVPPELSTVSILAFISLPFVAILIALNASTWNGLIHSRLPEHCPCTAKTSNAFSNANSG